MADYPEGPLGGKTPLELAKKPTIDYLAKNGVVGLIRTVPKGMKPGSDIANLSVMGYDPKSVYTGRSPLEALSIGVKMTETDIALRVNLVTLSDEEDFSQKTMVDYSSGEISTSEAKQLINDIQKALGDDRFTFYGGVSYRHCLIDSKGSLTVDFTPPHDISGRKIGEYLPKGEGSEVFLALMEKSTKILQNHPVNQKRKAEGKKQANCIWFWGAGTKPNLPSFEQTFGLKGSVISAVDLLKGIAKGAGMTSLDIEGATGNLDTNFSGKAQGAVELLKTHDFVYIHIEAPDECGHQGDAENKILAIEKVDWVTKYILDELNAAGECYVIAVLPDHATPLVLKTHTGDPVPFLVYRSDGKEKSNLIFTEKEAAKGIFLENGKDLLPFMLK